MLNLEDVCFALGVLVLLLAVIVCFLALFGLGLWLVQQALERAGLMLEFLRFVRQRHKARKGEREC